MPCTVVAALPPVSRKTGGPVRGRRTGCFTWNHASPPGGLVPGPLLVGSGERGSRQAASRGTACVPCSLGSEEHPEQDGVWRTPPGHGARMAAGTPSSLLVATRPAEPERGAVDPRGVGVVPLAPSGSPSSATPWWCASWPAPYAGATTGAAAVVGVRVRRGGGARWGSGALEERRRPRWLPPRRHRRAPSPRSGSAASGVATSSRTRSPIVGGPRPPGPVARLLGAIVRWPTPPVRRSCGVGAAEPPTPVCRPCSCPHPRGRAALPRRRRAADRSARLRLLRCWPAGAGVHLGPCGPAWASGSGEHRWGRPPHRRRTTGEVPRSAISSRSRPGEGVAPIPNAVTPPTGILCAHRESGTPGWEAWRPSGSGDPPVWGCFTWNRRGLAYEPDRHRRRGLGTSAETVSDDRSPCSSRPWGCPTAPPGRCHGPPRRGRRSRGDVGEPVRRMRGDVPRGTRQPSTSFRREETTVAQVRS